MHALHARGVRSNSAAACATAVAAGLIAASCAGGITSDQGGGGWAGDGSPTQDAADAAGAVDTHPGDDVAPDVTSESIGMMDSGADGGGGIEAGQDVGSPVDSSGTDGTSGGVCSPGSTESCAVCGTTGTATCTSNHAWGTCAPPAGVCAFVDQSCSAQCDTTSSCWSHVDRSYNATTGEHFYTTSDTEAACCGFTVEDEPYYYLYSAQQNGLVPFYRCLLSTGFHFYTTSSTCEGASGATNEGSMGFIATSATCGAVPLYRLYDATSGDHLYTTSSAEMTSAESGGYTYESIAGYVWTAPES